MNRLYVLVRADLKPAQQAVQAGHAVAEFCSHEEASRFHWDGRTLVKKPWRWRNEVLVYLSVKDEKELRRWKEELGEDAVAWEEPDWGYQLTAIAVVGKREQFAGLSLMG